MKVKDMVAVKVDKIHKLKGDSSIKAVVDLILLDCFCVKGIRIVEGREGLFVSMPQEQNKDGMYYDVFHPINQELRERLQELILAEYTKV